MCYDLAVIGGGAAGLASAITASRNKESVIVIEAGNAIGKKIIASGNGRCNLMNTGSLRYYGDEAFARQVLSQCSAADQQQFWNDIGLVTVTESENRVYPCTFQSASVVNVLKTALRLYGVEILLNAPVHACRKSDGQVFRIDAGDRTITARRVLIATGGPAGLKHCGKETGYGLLEKFGHHIIPVRPSLVPIRTEGKSISGLSGIRARCGISLKDNAGNVLHHENGEILFTDYGVSGICAMQCSRFVDEKTCYLEIDFAGHLFSDEEALISELRSRKKMFGTMPPETLLLGMLNARIAYAVMKQAGVPMKGETLDETDESILGNVARVLRHYRIGVTGIRDMEDAQVTAGGADCREFSADNMESRIMPGLHAAGEVLNVDGDCGGYNLMFAFGSGIIAGRNRRKKADSSAEGDEAE